jgi:hypothetical protein
MAGSMRGIIVATCILAASVLAACDRRESAWRDARRDDSQSAYQAYLDRYPTGVHAAQARAELEARREAEEWARAERLGTPEAWQRYLAGWPEGRHADEARRLLVAFIPPPRPEPLPVPVPPQVPPQVQGTDVPAGSFEIQLGAWSDESLARAGFERFTGAHAAAFAGTGLRLAGPGESGDALWRLRAGPFDETTARSRCAGLVAAGVSCVPVSPAPQPGHSPPFQ